MDKNLEIEASSQDTSAERLQELAEMHQDLAIIVASNPATPPQLLAQLSSSLNPNIINNIIQNSNIPINILWKYGLDKPELLLSNPAFSLSLSENPNLVTQISLENLIQLVKCKQATDILLEYASKQHNKKLALTIIFNPNASVRHLENIFSSSTIRR
jgi:hypothetical protein